MNLPTELPAAPISADHQSMCRFGSSLCPTTSLFSSLLLDSWVILCALTSI